MRQILVAGSITLLFYFSRKLSGIDIFYYLFLVALSWFTGSVIVALSGNIKWNMTVSSRFTDRCALAIIGTYILVISIMAIGRHCAYSTSMLDLGNMDQAIWNTTQGRLLEITPLGQPCENVPRLVNHVEWIYLIFSAIYTVFADVKVLLVGQTILTGAGLAGLYFISKSVLRSPLYRLVFLLSVSIYPALHFANLFDFHGDLLAFPMLIWAFFAYLKKAHFFHLLFLLLALLCKEYTAFAVALYGVFLIVYFKDYRNGILASSLAVLYFGITGYVVQPAFNSGNPPAIISGMYSYLTNENGGYWDIVIGLLRFPARWWNIVVSMHSLESLFYLFFPFLFVIYRNPLVLLPVIPVLLKDLLVGIDIGSHRLAIAIPYIYIAVCLGLQKIENDRPKQGSGAHFNRSVWIVLVSSLIASFMYGPTPIGHRFYRESSKYIPDSRDRLRDEFVRMVPSDAVLSASGLFTPHLTHRQYCYQFPKPFTGDCLEVRKVSCALIDTTESESVILNFEGFLTGTIPFLNRNGFSTICEKDGIYLMRRK